MLGSSGAYASSPEKILKMSDCVLKKLLKINIFLYKTLDWVALHLKIGID